MVFESRQALNILYSCLVIVYYINSSAILPHIAVLIQRCNKQLPCIKVRKLHIQRNNILVFRKWVGNKKGLILLFQLPSQLWPVGAMVTLPEYSFLVALSTYEVCFCDIYASKNLPWLLRREQSDGDSAPSNSGWHWSLVAFRLQRTRTQATQTVLTFELW